MHVWVRRGKFYDCFILGGRKLSEINVIPQPISKQSLRVEGSFEEFKICWDKVRNVNYGQVFYEIKITNSNKKDITVSY